MMINYKLSSPDLITYPDILHLLTDQDVRCYPLVQLLVDVIGELTGENTIILNYE